MRVIFEPSSIFSRISNDFPCNMNVDEIYSFHATKTFNSIEGGCAITSNKKIHKLGRNNIKNNVNMNSNTNLDRRFIPFKEKEGSSFSFKNSK